MISVFFTCFLRATTLLFYVINIIALARRDDVPYIVLLSTLFRVFKQG
ncbi:hypothetical protein HMPREF9532_01986 [Escherichia coli MS 57-2]|nr:hypothetical protein HMPREF9532_01986 [Escherichia coli MS 57-2]